MINLQQRKIQVNVNPNEQPDQKILDAHHMRTQSQRLPAQPKTTPSISPRHEAANRQDQALSTNHSGQVSSGSKFQNEGFNGQQHKSDHAIRKISHLYGYGTKQVPHSPVRQSTQKESPNVNSQPPNQHENMSLYQNDDSSTPINSQKRMMAKKSNLFGHSGGRHTYRPHYSTQDNVHLRNNNDPLYQMKLSGDHDQDLFKAQYDSNSRHQIVQDNQNGQILATNQKWKLNPVQISQTKMNQVDGRIKSGRSEAQSLQRQRAQPTGHVVMPKTSQSSRSHYHNSQKDFVNNQPDQNTNFNHRKQKNIHDKRYFENQPASYERQQESKNKFCPQSNSIDFQNFQQHLQRNQYVVNSNDQVVYNSQKDLRRKISGQSSNRLYQQNNQQRKPPLSQSPRQQRTMGSVNNRQNREPVPQMQAIHIQQQNNKFPAAPQSGQATSNNIREVSGVNPTSRSQSLRNVNDHLGNAQNNYILDLKSFENMQQQSFKNQKFLLDSNHPNHQVSKNLKSSRGERNNIDNFNQYKPKEAFTIRQQILNEQLAHMGSTESDYEVVYQRQNKRMVGGLQAQKEGNTQSYQSLRNVKVDQIGNMQSNSSLYDEQRHKNNIVFSKMTEDVKPVTNSFSCRQSIRKNDEFTQFQIQIQGNQPNQHDQVQSKNKIYMKKTASRPATGKPQNIDQTSSNHDQVQKQQEDQNTQMSTHQIEQNSVNNDHMVSFKNLGISKQNTSLNHKYQQKGQNKFNDELLDIKRKQSEPSYIQNKNLIDDQRYDQFNRDHVLEQSSHDINNLTFQYSNPMFSEDTSAAFINISQSNSNGTHGNASLENSKHIQDLKIQGSHNQIDKDQNSNIKFENQLQYSSSSKNIAQSARGINMNIENYQAKRRAKLHKYNSLLGNLDSAANLNNAATNSLKSIPTHDSNTAICISSESNTDLLKLNDQNFNKQLNYENQNHKSNKETVITSKNRLVLERKQHDQQMAPFELTPQNIGRQFKSDSKIQSHDNISNNLKQIEKQLTEINSPVHKEFNGNLRENRQRSNQNLLKSQDQMSLQFTNKKHAIVPPQSQRGARDKIIVAKQFEKQVNVQSSHSYKRSNENHKINDHIIMDGAGAMKMRSSSNNQRNQQQVRDEFDPNIFKNNTEMYNISKHHRTNSMPMRPHFQKDAHNQKILNNHLMSQDNFSDKVQRQALVNDQKKSPTKMSCDRFNCITKFAYATSVGHQPGNPNKQNQDSYILVPNMLSQLGLHFFAVCDGHGINGHHVSQYLKEKLPFRFQQHLELYQGHEDTMSIQQIEQFYSKVPQYLHNCFNLLHQELGNQKIFQYDSHLSGSTCCSVLFDRNTIFCANAGDSRAVLYSFGQDKTGPMKVTPLSIDHKPEMALERKRIESMGGRVDSIRGPRGQQLGPKRVWLKNQETPGLAMSRSIGDMLAHMVGVSSDPEVTRFELGPEHKFLVIASDGVWEFLSNEQIGKIVWPFYKSNSPEQAGNAIVRAAAEQWRKNDTVIDDITCVTIFLEVDCKIPKLDYQRIEPQSYQRTAVSQDQTSSKMFGDSQNVQEVGVKVIEAASSQQNLQYSFNPNKAKQQLKKREFK